MGVAAFGVATLAMWCVAFTCAAVSALAGMLVARAAAAPEDRDRWTWWTAGAAAWLFGQLAWDVQALNGSPVAGHVADLGWFAFALLVIGGTLRTRDRTAAARTVAALEVVPLVVAVMALMAAWLWTDVGESALPFGGRALATTYPILYVSAAVVMLQALVGGSLRQVHGGGPRLVLAGMAAEAAAFILWSDQLLAATYSPGDTAVDYLWVGGLVAIGAGGVQASRSGDAPSRTHEPERWGGLVPGITFALLVGALGHAEITDAPVGVALSLTAGLMTCGGMLALRGTLLGRRLRVLLARERFARRELAESKTELARLNHRLRQDVRRDPLTGLLNRRALTEDLPAIEAQVLEQGESFAIALCDVDHFKAYNDALGHLAGDNALREIAATIRGVLRAGDAAYRYGGEELLLLLQNTDLHGAELTAERVRSVVADAAIHHPAAPLGIVTVSVGVSAAATDAGSLIARADTALYEAKRTGRNRVMLATQDAAVAAPKRPAGPVEEPVLRHLRGVLGITRAAVGGHGALPVLEALAQRLRSELRFRTVVVNLRDVETDVVRVVLVAGSDDTRAALEGTSSPWSSWAPMLDPAYDRSGACWLPAGSVNWDDDIPSWTPTTTTSFDPDSWDPEDMLLLPLRNTAGEVIGVVSVDEPLSGRRPDDAQLSLLMAVVDHASVALEHARQLSAATDAPELRLRAVMLLAETLDLRDPSTAAHSRTVGTFVSRTATALELDSGHVRRLHAAGVLHDLGKVGIADAILHKPTALDDCEWREVRRHPELGARILEHAGLHDIATWVRAHHERIDGQGYPDGLAGAEIPLEARILAVADAYEAMTADRPYRAGLPPEEARAELLRCAGTQFDARVVDAFLRAVAEVGDTVAV